MFSLLGRVGLRVFFMALVATGLGGGLIYAGHKGDAMRAADDAQAVKDRFVTEHGLEPGAVTVGQTDAGEYCLDVAITNGPGPGLPSVFGGLTVRFH